MKYYETDTATIYNGECLEILKSLPNESINMCMTSPPYWGLRDYGIDAQIGLEKTPEEYTKKLIDIFREVKRVIKKDGTLWLNLGDSYCSTAPGTMGDGINQKGILSRVSNRRAKASKINRSIIPENLKPKDMVGIPWRVAFSLQADGWYLRADIIWNKPNPMPESVTDRPTKSHEYLFLLSKNQKYFYDQDAIKEKSKSGPSDIKKMLEKKDRLGGKTLTNNDLLNKANKNTHIGNKRGVGDPSGVNKKSVWTITTKPYPDAHFAVYPEELCIDPIKAGCPENGIVLDPFMGSGTTGFAALKLERKFVGIELNKKYCKLAKKRINMKAEQLKFF